MSVSVCKCMLATFVKERVHCLTAAAVNTVENPDIVPILKCFLRKHPCLKVWRHTGPIDKVQNVLIFTFLKNFAIILTSAMALSIHKANQCMDCFCCMTRADTDYFKKRNRKVKCIGIVCKIECFMETCHELIWSLGFLDSLNILTFS